MTEGEAQRPQGESRDSPQAAQAFQGAVVDNIPAPSPGWVFFLDIDGTLLDIAEHPNKVAVDPGLRALLLRLEAASAGALALISCRAIADIDRLFAPLRFACAGQHGAERRGARGRTHRRTIPDVRLSDARVRLGELAARNPGLVLEDKGFSVALHYRMAPHLAGEAQRTLRELVARLGAEFDLQEGKMVLEIKPSGRDKGSAIEEFMREEPFRGKVPVFLGDDLSDEFGFALVNKLGGHSIKIGGDASCARWRLTDATAVRAWLRDYTARFAPD